MIVSELIEQLEAMSPRDEVVVEVGDGFAPVEHVSLQRWLPADKAPEVWEAGIVRNNDKEFLTDVVVLWPVTDQ